MQASELRMWEGEWEFWGGQGLHVVSYSGSAAARTVIYEHELWLSPGCLDGKAPKRLKGDIASKVCMLVIWRCPLQAFLCINRAVCSVHETMWGCFACRASLLTYLHLEGRLRPESVRAVLPQRGFQTKSNSVILYRHSIVRCHAVLMRHTVR